jgi:hypothetical protein
MICHRRMSRCGATALQNSSFKKQKRKARLKSLDLTDYPNRLRRVLLFHKITIFLPKK